MCAACAQSEDLADLYVPPEAGDRWLQCPGNCAPAAPQPSSAIPDAPVRGRARISSIGAGRALVMSQAAVADGAAAQTAAARDPEQSGLSAQWISRGPGATNSGLYVPLLRTAAGDLAPAAAAEQRSNSWWEEARRMLAVSAPVR